MLRITALICLLLAVAKPAGAQFYSDDVLKAKQAKALDNLQYTVSQQLLGAAPPDIQQKLAAVRVVTPLRSPVDPEFPLGFFSNASEVVIPVSSLKFFSDLTILWVWFEQHHCDTRALLSYLTIAMTGRPEARSLAGPLEAFGIAEGQALRDPYIDNVSLRYFNTGMNFILAHELGHIYYGDGLAGSSEKPIAREERADHFAMDTLARAHIPPFGMIQLFSATRLNDPSAPAAPYGSHPLSHARLAAISSRIRQAPQDFLPTGLAPEKVLVERTRMLRMADEVDKIADAMKGEVFVSAPSKLADDVPPSTFRSACQNR